MLLFEGGEIVTNDGPRPRDILVDDGKIVAIGHELGKNVADAERVDARERYILPGLVDIHTHLREPGGEHKEDFLTGTSAAVAGGVTTVFGMPNTNPAVVDQQSLTTTLNLAEQKALCDFGLYVGATHNNAEEAAQLSDAVALKIYIGSSTGDLLVDRFEDQIKHFETYPRDRIIAVHAEKEEAVRYYASIGQRRPPICAVLSVAYLIALAEQIDRRLHICHVSTKAELDLIRDAKQRGVPVTSEACIHHLMLTIEEEHKSAFGKVNPPLRSAADVAALWENLDVLDNFATDHAPHTIQEKNSAKPPSGVPGLDFLLPVLMTAVHEGKLTWQQLIDKGAKTPADMFGMSHKGRLEIGADADLVLVQPDVAWTVTDQNIYTKCGWTPYLGHNLHGIVEQTFVRGKRVFANAVVLTQHAGHGHRVTTS